MEQVALVRGLAGQHPSAQASHPAELFDLERKLVQQGVHQIITVEVGVQDQIRTIPHLLHQDQQVSNDLCVPIKLF